LDLQQGQHHLSRTINLARKLNSVLLAVLLVIKQSKTAAKTKLQYVARSKKNVAMSKNLSVAKRVPSAVQKEPNAVKLKKWLKHVRDADKKLLVLDATKASHAKTAMLKMVNVAIND
jgi:spore coat polysaccharide biosynthesis predicted glycosyltransferase SpsG